MSKAPLSRAGAAPGSLGLTGTAGLQFKPKKFGLQKPKPLAAAGFGAAAGSASIFGEVADDDPVSVREELRRLAESKQKKAAAHAAQAAVLAQDPSIYDYDGAYDSITNERESAREAKKGKAGVEKKSRYIGSIMEAHKEREIENDKIFERRLVKEAEAEAHLYGDKDKFITSAYRKKLEAREAYEAEALSSGGGSDGTLAVSRDHLVAIMPSFVSADAHQRNCVSNTFRLRSPRSISRQRCCGSKCAHTLGKLTT